jgi:hypothetical protein
MRIRMKRYKCEVNEINSSYYQRAWSLVCFFPNFFYVLFGMQMSQGLGVVVKRAQSAAETDMIESQDCEAILRLEFLPYGRS